VVLPVLRWWATMTLIGWLAWPLAAGVFRGLPGRGYGLARALGLLALAYVYWLLGMAGVIPNSDGALWGVAVALAAAGLLGWWFARRDLGSEVRREWRHLLLAEALFAALLLLYAAHKAYDPAIDHTEEPMDFAFLNAMVRSPRFPPNDPWLAGHTVSYYYLGYLTVSLVGRLAGAPTAVGYNLGLAHTLALTAVGGYSVIQGLLRAAGGAHRQAGAQAAGVLGGVAVALAGNGAGILEALRARGVLSEAAARWFGVPGLAEAAPTGSWLPEGTWWWRASRIIHDANVVPNANILGKNPTVITEFPAFSFILGDLHPHVMALPYLMLGVGLAGALYGLGRGGLERDLRTWGALAVTALGLGALGFLNTWDIPTWAALGTLAFVGGRAAGQAEGLISGAAPGRAWRDGALLGVGLLVAAIVPYLPFYLSLGSQAQGIGLAYYAKTPLRQFVLCFAPWLLPLAVEVASTAGAQRARKKLRRALALWAAIVVAPWALTGLLGGPGRLILGLGVAAVSGSWLWIVLSAALALLGARLLWGHGGMEGARGIAEWLSGAALFLALALAYLCEFVYLRDLFDTRMNTVFKLYYQAWVLMGIGAVLVGYRQWRQGGWRRGAAYAAILLLIMTFYYPVAAAYTRGDGYRGLDTLDGAAYLREASPAEYGAYRWLDGAATGHDVVVEAPGEEYRADTSRLSAWTGVPTILGWPGHEAQWRRSQDRGGTDWLPARLADLETIYTSADREAVTRALRAYGATYLYVGPYERERYGVDAGRLAWYEAWLEVAYAEGEVRLYRVPRNIAR
jgi:YYY domain-containing protein